jgi:hypothetical protein
MPLSSNRCFRCRDQRESRRTARARPPPRWSIRPWQVICPQIGAARPSPLSAATNAGRRGGRNPNKRTLEELKAI